MITSHWSPQKQQIGKLLIQKTLQIGPYSFRARDKNPRLPWAPAYLDIRERNLTSYERHLLGVFLRNLGNLPHFTAVVGVPDAATPFAKHFAALYAGGNVVHLKLDKTTGELEEETKPGTRTLLLENVLSSGGSAREKGLVPLERHGLEVVCILAFLDWELGGKEALEADGYKVQAAFTASEVISLHSDELLKEVRAFQKEWHHVSRTLSAQ